MEGKISFGKESDFAEGIMKGFLVGSHKILVAKIDGKFYAVDSVCTHAKGPLDKGPMKEGIVTCPWHGSEFNIKTGDVVRGPAVEPLHKYEVTVENGELFLTV